MESIIFECERTCGPLFDILSNLDIFSLFNMCNTNKYFREMPNEIFWERYEKLNGLGKLSCFVHKKNLCPPTKSRERIIQLGRVTFLRGLNDRIFEV